MLFLKFFKIRLEQQTYEEEARIEDEERNQEVEIQQLGIQERIEQEEQNKQRLAMVRNWN